VEIRPPGGGDRLGNRKEELYRGIFRFSFDKQVYLYVIWSNNGMFRFMAGLLQSVEIVIP
jgi:hypothetical protein